MFSIARFNHIAREFVDCYHKRRPHQGIGNQLIVPAESDEAPSISSVDQVRCVVRLGGLLKSYSRGA